MFKTALLETCHSKYRNKINWHLFFVLGEKYGSVFITHSNKYEKTLRQVRLDKGMMVKYIEGTMWLPARMYSAIENGTRHLRFHEAMKMCEILELTPEQLLSILPKYVGRLAPELLDNKNKDA